MNEKAISYFYNKSALFSIGMIDFTAYEKPGVYCILDEKSWMCYIGSSGNCKFRLSVHLKSLLSNKNYSDRLQNAHNEGARFVYFVIEHTETIQTARLLEIYWIGVFGLSSKRLFNKNGPRLIVGRGVSNDECFFRAEKIGYNIGHGEVNLFPSEHCQQSIKVVAKAREVIQCGMASQPYEYETRETQSNNAK